MTDVAPLRRGSRFRFESAGRALEIDANLGARVVEFSLNGRNALFEGENDGGNHGSTLWTSPQRDWGWPPPTEIDRDPYVAESSPGSIVLASRASPALGVSIRKRFSMNGNGSVAIEYRIENQSSSARAVAPWEVTRVRRSGVSFFPRGASLERSPQFPAPPFVESADTVWVEHAAAATEDRKLHASGRAHWLAHAAEGLLFVKLFDAAEPGAQAPGEADIEIFVSGGAPYVELEEQGAYIRLEPGASLTWLVEWRLLELSDLPPRPSAELADLIRALV